MRAGGQPDGLLEYEARALLARLDQVKPFALHQTMVLAAALPRPGAAVYRAVPAQRPSPPPRTRQRISPVAPRTRPFVRSRGATAQVRPDPDGVQRRPVAVRPVHRGRDPAQRARHRRLALGTGRAGGRCPAGRRRRIRAGVRRSATWPGARERRSGGRTLGSRGGGANPVAIIRVPRERMVGSGIASSLVHEVGHQGAAQLGLVETLRGDLARGRAAEPDGVWDTFDRWLSEIVADCWSVGSSGSPRQ